MTSSTEKSDQQAPERTPPPIPESASATAGPPRYAPPVARPGLERTLPGDKRPPVLYLSILLSAVVTGLVSNFVFGDAQGIGLNVFVVMLTLFAGWYVVTLRRPVPAWRKLCAAAAVFYAAAFGFRASEILAAVNILLAIGFTGLACTAAYTQKMKSVLATIFDLIQVFFNVCFGWIMLVFEMPWRKLKPEKQAFGMATSVIIGLLISLPFLIIFGFLFSRAEVRFGQFFETIFTTLATTIFNNFWITFWVAVLAAGLLRGSFISASMSENQLVPATHPGRIGAVESATVLSMLNVLFFLFVITQLPYLFGGQDRVSETPDLAWSEYARRGFFELAWVVALLIPTLMLFLGSARIETPAQCRLIRLLASGLSLLTGIIIISALQRMFLYTHNFGLTELRVYVSAFIVMLALIILLLNVVSFTGRSQYFLPISLAIGVVFSIGIQVPNLQGIIARDIIDRHLTGRDGDIEYLASLSTDAVPAIVSSQLPNDDKTSVSKRIMSRYEHALRSPSHLDATVSAMRAAQLVNRGG